MSEDSGAAAALNRAAVGLVGLVGGLRRPRVKLVEKATGSGRMRTHRTWANWEAEPGVDFPLNHDWGRGGHSHCFHVANRRGMLANLEPSRPVRLCRASYRRWSVR